jgi:uncharacterized membrane protein required for colicin V production
VKIDVALLAAMAFFGLFGLLSGAIRQLAHVGGLIAGFLLAHPAGQWAGPLIAARLGYPVVLTSIAATFAAFFLLYIAAVFLLRLVLGKLFPDGERGALNRVGGFALGAAKAAALAFVVLSIALMADRALAAHVPGWRAEERSSIAVQLVRRYSPFTHLLQLKGLERLARASRDPEAAARLARDPELKALAKDARLKALAREPAIQRAAQSGDWARALESPALLELLDNPDISKMLARLSSSDE